MQLYTSTLATELGTVYTELNMHHMLMWLAGSLSRHTG